MSCLVSGQDRRMKSCKIICVLLVSIYHCSGHCMFRNYFQNNEQPSAFPTLNFHTFPEYFKPSFRIQNRAVGNLAQRKQLVNNYPNLSPRAVRPNTHTQPGTPSDHGALFRISKRPTALSSSFAVNPISSSDSQKGTLKTESTKSFIENSTPHITNTKKQTTQLNRQRNGMLAMIRNMLKPLMSKMENRGGIAKKSTPGRNTMNDNHPHGIHFKLIPKLVKKEVAKQLQTILGKRPIDKPNRIIKKGQNKIEENKKKSIEGINKKGNSTEQFNVNKSSSEEYKQEREYINKIGAKSIFGNFVGNKHFTNLFVFFPNNGDSPLVVGIKDNITDVFNVNTTDNFTEKPSESDKLNDEKIEKDKEENKPTENVENVLVGNKDDVSSNDNADNADNANKDNEEEPTEPTFIISTETMIPTSDAETSTTEIIPINDNITSVDTDDIVDSENDLAGNNDNEDENIEVGSGNGSPEKEEVSTPENNSKTTEDFMSTATEILTTELIYDNDDEATVLNEQTENPSENLSENLNNGEDETVNEDNLDEVNNEYDDIIKEKDYESTVVPVTNSTTDTTENSNLSTTEVLIDTEKNAETTANTETESEATSENTTELITTDSIESLTTSDEESSTQNAASSSEEDVKNSTTDNNNTTEDDYLDIEYAYF